MPIDLLTLGAAFLSGLLGSAHCLVMCGGVATSLSAAAAPARGARPALAVASALNAGRLAGYALAGALVGAFGTGLQRAFAAPAWQTGLRVALGTLLMLVALRTLGVGDRWNALAHLGTPVWKLIAPLRQRLVPARTLSSRLALGVLWGWLPCGLSASLLLAAWLEADALHGALVMAAFGAGTLPVMLPLTWSGARVSWRPRAGGTRYFAAAMIFVAGLLTAAAPWLSHVPVLHAALAALGCRSLP